VGGSVIRTARFPEPCEELSAVLALELSTVIVVDGVDSALETEEVVGPLFSVVVTMTDVVLSELFTNPSPTEAPITLEAMIAARITEISTLLVELMVYDDLGTVL
jgi:hypothetical protein